jgi:hypothetical protein
MRLHKSLSRLVILLHDIAALSILAGAPELTSSDCTFQGVPQAMQFDANASTYLLGLIACEIAGSGFWLVLLLVK